jgi:hypothetical protein
LKKFAHPSGKRSEDLANWRVDGSDGSRGSFAQQALELGEDALGSVSGPASISGRKKSLAAAARMSSRTVLALWLPILSMITISPGEVLKRLPSNRHGASIRQCSQEGRGRPVPVRDVGRDGTLNALGAILPAQLSEFRLIVPCKPSL